jgi:Mg2+ and Co2+ transporter CorA
MNIKILLKIIKALQESEKIKKELEYCRNRREKGICTCRIGELCQRALAKSLNLSDDLVKRYLLILEKLEDNLIEIRSDRLIKRSYPRKFIRLKNFAKNTNKFLK